MKINAINFGLAGAITAAIGTKQPEHRTFYLIYKDKTQRKK